VSRAAPPSAGRSSAADLFCEHAPFVARFAAKLGVPHDDVDDVVQEVFLTAFRLGDFEPGRAKATTWLAEIALRVVSTRRRSASRHRLVTDDDVLRAAESPGASPHELAELRGELERVERALATMDLDRRAVFVLFEIEGESCASIAAGLSVPVGTVYSRLHLARKEFAAAFARLEGPSPARLAPLEAASHPARGESP
jgi:RNA polymerase sigma-70 factor (ECF subfamily)